MPKAYPNEVITFDNYFGRNVLNKRYRWVDIDSYPIVPDGYTSEKLIAVSIKEFSITSNDTQGTKEISLTLQER
jgi:hypothetical protein